MEDTALGALAKLTKAPFTIPRFPKQRTLLAQARSELAKFEAGQKVSLKRLAFFSSWRKTQGPIEKQVAAIKAQIASLEADCIEGVLVPLTEAEDLECRAHYVATLERLKETLKEFSKQERETASELVSHTAYAAKFVQCSLKKSKKDGNGEWVRALESTQGIDPSVIKDIHGLYVAAFVLSQAEKKN